MFRSGDRVDVRIVIYALIETIFEIVNYFLMRSSLLDAVNILKLSRATYRKMIQNLVWATGYNLVALPLAAGILYNQGIVISPAVGAVLMSLSTIIVAVNARLLKLS